MTKGMRYYDAKRRREIRRENHKKLDVRKRPNNKEEDNQNDNEYESDQY